MSSPTYNRIAVVGVGLIGGSVALAARERGLADAVVGLSRSDASADKLQRLGVVDAVFTDWTAGLEGVELTIVATPVGVTAATVLRALEASPDTLVTDAASTKADIVAAVSGGGSAVEQFVGAHPLAGDHRTGAENARADLFEGALTVVTPTDATSDEAKQAIESLWTALGSRVVAMSPEEHDQRLARTSHLPHVVASALAAATPADDLPLAATGWADTTRVAAGSPELWRDILMANALATRAAIGSLQTELAAIDDALSAGDAAKVEEFLARGKRRRDALGG